MIFVSRALVIQDISSTHPFTASLASTASGGASNLESSNLYNCIGEIINCVHSLRSSGHGTAFAGARE